MCFFLGNKFNGSIIFDIRGQHEVLEVKVITNIRTIINYVCRPLLVGETEASLRTGQDDESA